MHVVTAGERQALQNESNRPVLWSGLHLAGLPFDRQTVMRSPLTVNNPG